MVIASPTEAMLRILGHQQEANESRQSSRKHSSDTGILGWEYRKDRHDEASYDHEMLHAKRNVDRPRRHQTKLSAGEG